jgi:hypothetical protein
MYGFSPFAVLSTARRNPSRRHLPEWSFELTADLQELHLADCWGGFPKPQNSISGDSAPWRPLSIRIAFWLVSWNRLRSCWNGSDWTAAEQTGDYQGTGFLKGPV